MNVCVRMFDVAKLQARSLTLNNLNSDETVWKIYSPLFFYNFFPVLITQLSLRWIPFYVLPIEYICI